MILGILTYAVRRRRCSMRIEFFPGIAWQISRRIKGVERFPKTLAESLDGLRNVQDEVNVGYFKRLYQALECREKETWGQETWGQRAPG